MPIITFIIFVVVLLLIFITAYLTSPKNAAPISYLPLDANKKYKAPAGWKGTCVDRKNRFVNYEFPFYQDYLKIIYWLPGHLANLWRNRKYKFPVHYHESGKALSENETLIWLGHASFFLRINNINILIDPHFNNTFIYKRHTDNPIDPQFFKDINYILLSHDHADHCDKRTLQLLLNNNPEVTILTGLRMATLIRSFVQEKVNIITAKWYEEFDLSNSVQIYFVPTRHYSKRVFNNFNERLWGGFVIRYTQSSGDANTIYYGGDSGYGSHFKDIKELFHPRIAILPIGAYKPKWFMHPNHMCPDDVLKAFNECGAEILIPMHYSTFNLSNENMGEPLEKLLKHNISNKILSLQPGEILKIVGH